MKTQQKPKTQKRSITKNIDPERWDCKDCGKKCNVNSKDYYMVTNELWEKHGVVKGMLCMDCIEVRIGRKLEKFDIMPCRVTEISNPYTQAILNTH